MNYSDIKKLDKQTLEKLKEGTGPADECLCSLLAPPASEDKRSIRFSIKKALGKVKDSKGKEDKGKAKTRKIVGQGQSIEIPLAFTQGGVGGNLKTTKEVVKHKGSCGKCGCDKEDVVLNHSVASIRITSPDISTFCPCPSHECLPAKDRQKLKNNINVTIERIAIDPNSENSETSIHRQQPLLESPLYKKSVSSLINAQYDMEEHRLLSDQETVEQKKTIF